MKGKAAVAMWWDIAPRVRAEWEHWHSTEHMHERLAIPGFLRGTRWAAASGKPSYFVLYEAKDLKTISGGAYLRHLNHPTPWSRRMMPQHRNMVRSLCLVRRRHGDGLPQALATLRFSSGSRFSRLPRGKGLTGAMLLESQPMTGPRTTEQKIRGGDKTADRVLLVFGYDLGAVRRAATATGLRGTLGLYRLSYSLLPGEAE